MVCILKRLEVLNQNNGFGVACDPLGLLLEKQNFGLVLRGPEILVLLSRQAPRQFWRWWFMDPDANI